LLNADPKVDNWAQLPHFYLDILKFDNLKSNFDDTVQLPVMLHIPEFYVQAFRYYNKIFVTDREAFEKNILNEYIWFNKFITEAIGKKNRVLFLRNWIRSGIRKISDLKFINGKVDTKSMFDIIIDKRNIFNELLIVYNALLPYATVLKNLSVSNVISSEEFTCKQFYTRLLEKKVSECVTISKYLEKIVPDCNAESVFSCKVLKEKEIKLKEFNFKVLHGILPCNNNLKKWRIRMSDLCDVCDCRQSIEHLLFECHYVKPLWNTIGNIFEIGVTFPII
jgi:hypothetical protein